MAGFFSILNMVLGCKPPSIPERGIADNGIPKLILQPILVRAFRSGNIEYFFIWERLLSLLQVPLSYILLDQNFNADIEKH